MAKVEHLISKAREITEELSNCMDNQELDDTDKLVDFINTKTTKLEEVLENAEIEVESMREDMSDLENEIADLKSEIDELNSEISNLESQLEDQNLPENLHDEMKHEIIRRLYKNLTLEQLENVETVVKNTIFDKKNYILELP